MFFFETHGDHRDLHSFPTRRSSDLSKDHNVRLRELARRQGLSVSEYGVFDEQTGARVAGTTEEEVDRKSTRLNSSHRTISYAVFCLKKKNKKKTNNTTETTDLTIPH